MGGNIKHRRFPLDTDLHTQTDKMLVSTINELQKAIQKMRYKGSVIIFGDSNAHIGFKEIKSQDSQIIGNKNK